ncbi:RagB/SusD family nutrient uptake outer membrane protein [Mucilaginibacter sp. SJ]|uniref:RagB/SusD family nutrient uptake outer membrane protein n=1 Tax=Mucilaginibacter sp. SJ TaxID=3029053 RepID=UPI0023A9F8C0|nr:RagB/SusD family nutrient uptake outer membrane protein [Mucilaginibacter sp. SJ]WEA00621.1 RagB/SusD family nutrient uptake outer membrane protein [Mucilaginibacter sp. SJ]
MKKNFKIATIISVLTFLSVSCKKDLLNVTPTDRLSTAVFWKSASDADLALSGLYNYLYAGGGNWGCSQYEIFGWDNYTDDSYGQYDYGGGLTATSSGITPMTGGYVSSYYSNNYQAIAAINSFLANVGKVLSGTQLDQYKGEAYFLRAFNYFYLAQLYGNVPIVTADPFTVDYKKGLAKSTRDDVLKFVETDLDAAIATLPDNSYTGHAVKATAQGYKVRVLLFEKKYAEAAQLANAIIQGGKFSLASNYAGNFYKPDQNTSPEIMFSVRYLAPNILHADAAVAVTVQRWKGYLGTQDLINEYEAGDPRKTMTFYFSGDTNAQGWPFTGDLAVATPGKDSWITGYYAVKKWLTPGLVNPDYGTIDDNDFVLLRFADIKLMYAEAQNEATGPNASVYQQINEVRARPGVNMAALPAGLTQAQMRDKIRHERRVEFAMEGIRYFDLRRWGIATQKINGFVSNPLVPNTKLKYEDKYEYWPIPQTEIDRNQGVLTQNPGY